MVRLNRIYTKAGDGGDTRLVGGQKVAQGLAAHRGLRHRRRAVGVHRPRAHRAERAGRARRGAARWRRSCARIQNELFNLGSDLATLPEDRHPKQPVIEARHVTALEREIDGWNERLRELRSFILPGGGWVASYLHLARTVCRRAERLRRPPGATPRPIGEQVAPLPESPVRRAVRDEPPRLAPLRRARAALGAREDLSGASRRRLKRWPRAARTRLPAADRGTG